MGFFREHQYGLATQSFGGWMGDQLKELAISLIITPVGLIVLYAVLRRAPRTWWLWGAVVTIAMLLFVVAIAPVYIAPIFNKYTRLEPGPLRDDILRLAHANGIRAEEVYEVDASRQTTRVSANVSGMFGTERITLNDNLLKRASPAAIQAVMGHEMGHYVLNHVNKMMLAFAVLTAIGFGIVAWGFERLARRHHARWRVEGIADPAGLPLIALLFSVVPVPADAGDQFHHSHQRVRGRRVRLERRTSTGRLRRSCAPTQRLPQDVTRVHRGTHLLRSSKRSHADLHCHAMESLQTED